MPLNLPEVLPLLRLDLGAFAATALEAEPALLVGQLRAALMAPTDHVVGARRADLAILYLLGRAGAGTGTSVEPALVPLIAQWMKDQWKEAALLQAILADAHVAQLEDLHAQIVEQCPDVVATAISGSIFLTQEARARMLQRIACDAREAVREHLFALLGNHQRLVPPGSLTMHKISQPALTELLQTGIDDRVSAVRQRAIALAFGLDAVELVRDRIFARLGDEALGVRAYALLALGTLRDAESRAALVARLEHGSQAEATSAIWALARRPDGIEQVLRLAGDPRPWVEPELLGAFAEVAVPLTDEQIAALRAGVTAVEFPRLLDHHLQRTRHGLPERGADGRVTYVIRNPGATNPR
jgi:predicted nucleic acid-binding protein